LYSAFIGGSQDDRGIGIKVDDLGSVYLTGSTSSPKFPVYHAFQSSLTSAVASFVLVLNPAGTALQYSTLFGGTEASSTVPVGLAFDHNDSLWLAGATNSITLPTRRAYQPAFSGGRTAGFVAKFNTHRTGDASLIASSYFAAGRDVRPAGIDVDPQGRPSI